MLKETDKNNIIHGDNQISDRLATVSDASDGNQNSINFNSAVDQRKSPSNNSQIENGSSDNISNKYSNFASKICRSDPPEYLSPSSFEKWKKEYSSNSLLRQIMASSMGTCVSVLTLNPMSVVKLRLQRQDIFMETTVQGAFRTIYKKDGIKGFWAGELMVDS